MQDAADEAVAAVSAILPIALPILGIILAIGIGIKVFKKVTGR